MSQVPRGADGGTDSAEATWRRCLDTFQDHLEQQWEALHAGRVEEIQTFPVPPGMAPVPPRLATAATALLEQAEELERALALAQEAVRRQLRLARRMDTTVPVPASFIVHRA